MFAANGFLIVTFEFQFICPQKLENRKGNLGEYYLPTPGASEVTSHSSYLDDRNWILCMRLSGKFFAIETQYEKVDCSS